MVKYVTTNIRLPHDLWYRLKIEAAKRGLRLSQLVRERLGYPEGGDNSPVTKLRGMWKNTAVPDHVIEEAKSAWLKPG